MSPKNYKNPFKTVARANFAFSLLSKKLSIKSKLKIKEYVSQVSSKSFENCD